MNGTITKHKCRNGQVTWGYVIDAKKKEGKRDQITKKGFKTKHQAQDALRQKISEIQSGTLVEKHGITFGQFFTEWLQQHGAAHWQNKTRACNRQRAAYAIRKFGDVPLQNLTPRRIEQDLLSLLTGESENRKPLSPKSVKEIASLVNQALAKAVRWRLIPVNPMLEVELPRCQKKEALIPDEQEYERYLDLISGTRYFAFSVFCAASGCRRGEALALQWPDVDLRTGFIRFSKSLSEVDGVLEVKHTKNQKTRHVQVSPTTIAVLKNHKHDLDRERDLFGDGYQDNGLVFPKPDGGYYKPDQVSARISGFMRKGVKWSPLSRPFFALNKLISDGSCFSYSGDRDGSRPLSFLIDRCRCPVA